MSKNLLLLRLGIWDEAGVEPDHQMMCSPELIQIKYRNVDFVEDNGFEPMTPSLQS